MKQTRFFPGKQEKRSAAADTRWAPRLGARPDLVEVLLLFDIRAHVAVDRKPANEAVVPSVRSACARKKAGVSWRVRRKLKP